MKLSIKLLSRDATSLNNAFLPINPVFPLRFTVISAARSLITLNGSGKGFTVDLHNVEFGCQINSDVFCIRFASNLIPNNSSVKLIPLPK